MRFLSELVRFVLILVPGLVLPRLVRRNDGMDLWIECAVATTLVAITLIFITRRQRATAWPPLHTMLAIAISAVIGSVWSMIEAPSGVLISMFWGLTFIFVGWMPGLLTALWAWALGGCKGAVWWYSLYGFLVGIVAVGLAFVASYAYFRMGDRRVLAEQLACERELAAHKQERLEQGFQVMRQEQEATIYRVDEQRIIVFTYCDTTFDRKHPFRLVEISLNEADLAAFVQARIDPLLELGEGEVSHTGRREMIYYSSIHDRPIRLVVYILSNKPLADITLSFKNQSGEWTIKGRYEWEMP